MTDDVLITVREIKIMAERVVRGIVPDDTNETVIGLLIDDLSRNIENTLCDWATSPHPLLQK